MHDSRLARRACDGDAAAAGELFERHWPRAWRIAFSVTGDRSLADDAAQVALIRAFANLRTFDASRPFAPWLNRIVSRAAVDQLRARPRWAAEALELPGEQVDDHGADELSERVGVAVLELAEDRRTVVVLRYWADQSIEEIASLLDLPPGTVASRLSRALADLKAKIEGGSHARRGA